MPFLEDYFGISGFRAEGPGRIDDGARPAQFATVVDVAQSGYFGRNIKFLA